MVLSENVYWLMSSHFVSSTYFTTFILCFLSYSGMLPHEEYLFVISVYIKLIFL